MSLNLDQLLADWGEYQRLINGGSGSATVQPDSATTASDSSPGGQP
jgi:hypothetical protein